MRTLLPTRRRFLKSAAAAALAPLAPMIVRPSVLGAADGTPAPSNRITLGFIGVGKQGTNHLGALVRRSDVNILAISDVQQERRDGARDVIGKATDPSVPFDKRPKGPDANSNSPWAIPAGAPPSTSTGPAPATRADDVKYYANYHELLARKDIDAVLIATPDHWHCLTATAACVAGKDVYCEKPLTLTLGEARDLIDTVRRYNRVFQVGSQQRSSGEFRFACEMVRSGRIGQLKSVTVFTGTPSVECTLPAEPIRAGVDWDQWLGPAPYRPFNKILCPPADSSDWAMWRLYRDYSGGAMTDFGAHHFDIAQWGMNTDDTGPVEILPPRSAPRKLLTFRYANGIEIYHSSIGKDFGGKGLTFEGTQGKIDVDRGYLETTPASLKRIPTHAGETFLYKSPGHHEDWLRSIRSRTQGICPVEVGANSAAVCHLGNLCYWLDRPLKWDPSNWRFIDDEEANRWVDRPQRTPST